MVFRLLWQLHITMIKICISSPTSFVCTVRAVTLWKVKYIFSAFVGWQVHTSYIFADTTSHKITFRLIMKGYIVAGKNNGGSRTDSVSGAGYIITTDNNNNTLEKRSFKLPDYCTIYQSPKRAHRHHWILVGSLSVSMIDNKESCFIID